MRGAVQTSDDRARQMAMSRTRKDKPSGEKWEMRKEEKMMNRARETEAVKADLGLMDECVFR